MVEVLQLRVVTLIQVAVLAVQQEAARLEVKALVVMVEKEL